MQHYCLVPHTTIKRGLLSSWYIASNVHSSESTNVSWLTINTISNGKRIVEMISENMNKRMKIKWIENIKWKYTKKIILGNITIYHCVTIILLEIKIIKL